MLTEQEARARVAVGAALLDKHIPDWPQRIDTGTLQLANPCDCILGQLSEGKGWSIGLPHEFQRAMNSDGLSVTKIGCMLFGDTTYGYRLLQDAWIAAIADRLTPDAPEPADAKLEAVTA